MNKILIAGATGFVGKHLITFLNNRGYKLVFLTRKNSSEQNKTSYQWNIEEGFIDKDAFEGVDIIINLTGANIGEKRWTKNRKKEILDSRLKSIELIFKYVKENNFPIKTFISSCAVGHYGAVTSERIFNEESERGNDFLASVCGQWENVAMQFEKIGTKVIILRKGIILSKSDGFYKKIAFLAKWGINPAVGSGNQYIPWIDIRDLMLLYEFLLNRNELKGIFNAVSSQHITMNELSQVFLSYFGKKKIFPNAPAFLIKLLLGEMSCILLNGSRVSNEKIKSQGFYFLYDKLYLK